MADPRPIGVFDSGVGGLTVLREILRRLPAESTIYLGDNARAPYGTRSDDEVRRFSTEALDRLVREDVKALVVACNTSTAVALGEYRRRYDTPVLGVIRPGAQAAALATRTRRVGVVATPATIRSHAYFDAIKEENPAVEVYEHATPALVPARGGRRPRRPARSRRPSPMPSPRCSAGATRTASSSTRSPPSARIDTLLLGCTHYPLLRPGPPGRGGRGRRDRRLGDRHRGRAGGAPLGERARGARARPAGRPPTPGARATTRRPFAPPRRSTGS